MQVRGAAFGSFSEDPPEGGPLLPQAIGRGMECPEWCLRRKLPNAACGYASYKYRAISSLLLFGTQ